MLFIRCATVFSVRNKTAPRTSKKKLTTTSTEVSGMINNVSSKLLADAWTRKVVDLMETRPSDINEVTNAVEKTLLLFEGQYDGGRGPAEVPLVGRYHTDVIHPLKPQQVRLLHSLFVQHKSLSSLRSKVLQLLPYEQAPRAILTSASKLELQEWHDIWCKPSPQRTQEERPDLVHAVDDSWKQQKTSIPLKPREDLFVRLMASRIAGAPKIAMVVSKVLSDSCRIHTTLSRPANSETNNGKDNMSTEQKYENYDDFRGRLLNLKDHQVLAIRRGVKLGHLLVQYDIDETKIKASILSYLETQEFFLPEILTKHRDLLKESIQDAWTRVLRQQEIEQLWTAKCNKAEERAYQVFQDNLKQALLATPFRRCRQETLSPFLLALDPGYQTGIKCSILDFNGQLKRLDTVTFLDDLREEGVKKMMELLNVSVGQEPNVSTVVAVALGNGLGSHDCRKLLEEAAARSQISVDIHIVNKAGTNAWSVTAAARQEFPNQKTASLASISIGRRLLNPRCELVKVPPRSLGLGMYQHDLNGKKLEELSHLVAASVGIDDVKKYSEENLMPTPTDGTGSLIQLASQATATRPSKIEDSPLKSQAKQTNTFQNWDGVRQNDEVEPLGATLLHTKSPYYEFFDWILKQLTSKSLDLSMNKLSFRDLWRQVWSTTANQDVVPKVHVGKAQSLEVLDNHVDPDADKGMRERRLNFSKRSTKGCSILPSGLADPNQLLASAVPVQGIIGTIQNVSDFGVFIDFGGHNNGLLHKSKLGSGLALEEFYIGQRIGVDILDVNEERVTLSVHGVSSQNQHPHHQRRIQRRKQTSCKK